MITPISFCNRCPSQQITDGAVPHIPQTFCNIFTCGEEDFVKVRVHLQPWVVRWLQYNY